MPAPTALPPPQNIRVLAICCYMADRLNLAEDLLNSIKEARIVQIDLVVTNNTTASPAAPVEPYVKYTMPRTPKFVAVSRIIKEQFKTYHNYVILIDDDVKLPPGFFDKYFQIVKGLGFVLSQPALTKDSNGTWPCCYQIDAAIAHLVSFVEIGPVTCFERRIMPLLPLAEGSPMGWGLDYVWARICRDRRWPMGVVDLVPVQHTLRQVAKLYDKKEENLLKIKYLKKIPHAPLCVTNVIGQTFLKSDYPGLS
jgi:hypothetical protein